MIEFFSSKVAVVSVICFFVLFPVAADRFLKSPFRRVFFFPRFSCLYTMLMFSFVHLMMSRNKLFIATLLLRGFYIVYRYCTTKTVLGFICGSSWDGPWLGGTITSGLPTAL